VFALDAISGPVSSTTRCTPTGARAFCVMDQVGDSKNTDEVWLEQIALSEAHGQPD
jgi:RNA polymerase sporulation-specific sigma factor